MKKITFVAVFALALASLLGLSPLRAETLRVCKTPTGVGWLERTAEGDRILHLQGSFYDMGWQHAKLLAEDTRSALRSAKFMLWLNQPLMPSSVTMRLIHREVSEKQAPFIPADFIAEMQGMADASGVSLATIEAIHSLTYLTSCAGAAAWGRATADGQLLFMRSNDLAAAIDPLTLESFHDRGMIFIYQPQDGIPFMMISWPGFIGASDGMNAEGIAIGNMSLPSRFETPAGVPMLFRLKQALAKSHTLDEAVAWMTAKPLEGGYNFIVADAKIPSARVLETDAQTVYAGGWDGPAESNHYVFQGREYAYVPLPDLILRTNHSLSSELIAHRELKMDDGVPLSRLSYQRYADLHARLAAEHGRLGLQSMMELLRASYRAIRWEKGPSLGLTSHQFVFAPQSGELLIAFSHGNPGLVGRRAASAFSQPYRRYNFRELLEREPEP